MNKDIKNNEVEEALHDDNPRMKANPIFLCMPIGAIAVLVLGFVLILNSYEAKDTHVEASTVVTTESIPEPTVSIPETMETIPDKIVETVPEVTESPVTDESNQLVNLDDYELLARVIYQEAGGDAVCDECRRRVADVVLNRVRDERFRDQDTIYEVLTREGQYGRFHWTGVVWPERAAYESEHHAVKRAYQIAAEVLNGQHSDLYELGYVWQAEFPQGYDVVFCCGIYFGR